jgi:hypothetical protein
LALLFGLEVVEEDRSLLRLLTPVLDDNTGAVNNLACVSLAVQHTYSTYQHRPSPASQIILTQTSPLAQLLSIRNLDQGDLVLRAKRNDQLLVCLLLTSLVQDTHVCLASVEGLGSFAQTTGQTIVHQSELENTLQSVENGHLTLGCGISRDFDFVGFRDFGGIGCVVFYVTLLGG